MPFIDDATLSAEVAKTLQKENLGDSFWPELITASNSFAYWEIVSRLAARGYSKGQVDQWDRGVEFQRSLGIFWALNHLAEIGGEDQYSTSNLRLFDRRSELSGSINEGIPPVLVTIAGVFVDPVNLQGQAVVGAMDISQDLFVPFDDSDSRIGVPTIS